MFGVSIRDDWAWIFGSVDNFVAHLIGILRCGKYKVGIRSRVEYHSVWQSSSITGTKHIKDEFHEIMLEVGRMESG